jgi:hypothetical protein
MRLALEKRSHRFQHCDALVGCAPDVAMDSASGAALRDDRARARHCAATRELRPSVLNPFVSAEATLQYPHP